MKHNEKVCHAQYLGSKVRGQNRVSAITQKLLKQMKLHRKIEHNEKVCRAQELGYYAQGQGHNHVRCQIALKVRSE